MPFSFKIEFDSTNNVVEYEALISSIQVAKKMGVQCISIYGDSELIIRQIKNHCQTKHLRLRSYMNEVWDLIENYFEAFNIQYIPREDNRLADSLAVAGRTFKPPINPRLRYEIEVRHRSPIPENVKHWQVFDDDEQINQFLKMVGSFEYAEIDQEEEQTEQRIEIRNLKKSIGEQKVIQFKENVLPRGLVPLERLFNAKDVFVDSKKKHQQEEIEDCNLGTQ